MRTIHVSILNLLICLVCASALPPSAAAKNVVVQHRGHTLNANLQLAPGKRAADGMILITHGGLAHGRMQTLANLQKVFLERGFSTLAITLSLGLNDRAGMYDCSKTHTHLNSDSGMEISAWLRWLREQGANNVVLLGHSRGGAQTALFAARHDTPQVQAVVLMAPTTRDNGHHGYQKRFKTPLAPTLKRAQQLLRTGGSKTILRPVNLMFCRGTAATAEAFLSYYSDTPDLDTPALIPEIRKPLLVVTASEDTIVVKLEDRVADLMRSPKRRLAIVDAAGHFFRDLFADDVVDEVENFLQAID